MATIIEAIKYTPTDAELYDYENLKDEDKLAADVLEDAINSMNPDVVEEYLDTLNFGEFTKAMLREQLLPFLETIKSKLVAQRDDYIYDQINTYSVEVYRETIRALDKKKKMAVGSNG